MPIGYTGNIYEGKKEVTGKDFIRQCARAFGGLVHMRDDDADAPWTLIDVDSQIKYGQDSLARSIDRLNDLNSKSDENIEKDLELSYQNKIASNAKIIKNHLELKARYEKVLKEVEDWMPPTPEHEELKSFAIEQLTKSIEFDCDCSYYEKPVEKENLESYKESMTKMLEEGIVRDKQHIKDAIKRTEERNQWILKLQESLK